MIRLTVNGQIHDVDAEPEETILQVQYQALAQAMQQRGRVTPQLQFQPQHQQFQTQQPQQQEDIAARVRQVLREEEAYSVTNDFLSDPKNIYLDEPLVEDMAYYITSKRADSIEQAYEMACNARPEIRAVLLRQASANPGSVSETDRARRTASEARAAAKATVGAPSGPRPEPKDDRPPNAPAHPPTRYRGSCWGRGAVRPYGSPGERDRTRRKRQWPSRIE